MICLHQGHLILTHTRRRGWYWNVPAIRPVSLVVPDADHVGNPCGNRLNLIKELVPLHVCVCVCVRECVRVRVCVRVSKLLCVCT